MKKRLTMFAAGAIAAGAVFAEPLEELKISADRIVADRVTGAMAATGNVCAVASPVSLRSQYITKSADGVYEFSDPTSVTTCTNDWDSLHWRLSGEVRYSAGKHVILKNAWLRMFNVPVLWFPYWYYPMDTDYGLRVMPGYTGRWGAYLMTKYVYGLYGGYDPGELGLSGNTRFDWRHKNGVALGQALNWQLGDFGRGKFKVYYAWDENEDRYDRHWSDRRHWNYRNWGSEVPGDRYAISLEHHADLTERDALHLAAAYYSDSHFRRDFLKKSSFGVANRFDDGERNVVFWEHAENPFAFGVGVSGPLNDFRSGVARLPEAYFDFHPSPVFGTRATYESQTRLGYLDRDYAKYGDRDTALPFRYNPGPWANYNAFRFDTYHRIALPFKIGDVVSAVPRVGYRGTFWSESGETVAGGVSRAGEAGEIWRSIVEGGVTFAARGTADVSEGLRHVVEPYFDALAQEASYSGLRRGSRPYVFDGVDGSSDWLDQFAGRSRNLPYSWYGVTPGLRNAFRKIDGRGGSRAVFDFDVYSAVQLNDTSFIGRDRYHRLVKHPRDPNYGHDGAVAVPGVRTRWTPAKDVMLGARAEYDTENDKLAYASLIWKHRLDRDFDYYVTCFGRNHRWWDYSHTAYDPETMKNDDFNRAHFQYVEAGCEHDFCDALAWSPYLRWDCREAELDEVGAWFDLRTDCLGFRFSVSYENEYTRIDGSERDDDWRFGFFVYLRALGPASGSPFGD